MATTHDLDLVQGESYERAFRRRIDGVAYSLAGHSWAAQIRQKESRTAELVLDLAPYLALDEDDPTLLNLTIPGNVTSALPKVRAGASWDLFAWPDDQMSDAFLFVQGAASLDLAVSVLA